MKNPSTSFPNSPSLFSGLTDMLEVAPSQTRIGFQHQCGNAGCQRSRCTCAGVRAGAHVMQICRHDLFFVLLTAAVCRRQRGAALLGIPWNVAVLGGAGDRQRPDRVCVSITVAIVLFASTIARRPNENASFSAATLRHAIDESLRRHLARAVDRFAVVIRSPRRAVDVNVLRLQSQAHSFNGIGDVAIQHPHAANPRVKCNSNGTKWIVGSRSDFARTSCAMAIRISHVVVRHGIGVVAVNIITCLGILKGDETRRWVKLRCCQWQAPFQGLLRFSTRLQNTIYF